MLTRVLESVRTPTSRLVYFGVTFFRQVAKIAFFLLMCGKSRLSKPVHVLLYGVFLATVAIATTALVATVMHS